MESQQLGYVAFRPIFKAGEGHLKDREGNVRQFPFIRTLSGNQFRMFPEDILTNGLETLKEGQRVKFVLDPDGYTARDIERVPFYQAKRWREEAEAIRTRNGQSCWVEATVRFYNPTRGFGFAELAVNGSEVFIHIKSVIRRDPDDIPGFQEGDKIFVRLAGPAKPGKRSPEASSIICLE